MVDSVKVVADSDSDTEQDPCAAGLDKNSVTVVKLVDSVTTEVKTDGTGLATGCGCGKGNDARVANSWSDSLTDAKMAGKLELLLGFSKVNFKLLFM